MKKAAYLNFEDTQLYGANYKELREITGIFIELYGKEPDYILLDEVQNRDNWKLAVRELCDLKKSKIIVTGSLSKLLGKEIATHLLGGSLSFLLLPFSFREFLRMKGIIGIRSRDEESIIKNLLREFF